MSRSSRPVLALLPALTLTACGVVGFAPVPAGDPTVLSPARTATVWTDARGGTLELKPDGTIAADDVCHDSDTSIHESVTVSGSGTWETSEREGLTTVSVSFDNGAVIDDYEARRYGRALKLWTYIGDPATAITAS
ncbi:hypothetical protein AB0D13_17675 [Streptomyces sp. NPDC048430]|uniref:hypothetical protein n=1 Tax=Streptomyces sp. NPDC048430 TaxID=3155388 RepID=UPI003423EA73